MTFRVEGLDHVGVDVGDQAATERWYRDVLGLEREHAVAWGDRPVALMAQGSGLALFKATPDERPGQVSHVAFRVDRENFEAAQDDLRRRGVAFDVRDHEVSHSIYFLDPEGLKLELTTYEV